MIGQIYCIKSFMGKEKPVKIGFTTNLDRRFAQIQTGNPDHLVLFENMPGTREMERDLHERFAGRRMKGEWFCDDDGKITAFFAKAAWEARVGAAALGEARP